ncbi:phosphoenolpyruvate--protein phosphotransferase [Thalassotalea agariperforans]
MLTTLRRIVLEFSQEPELENALSRMVTQVKAAMQTDCCSVYLADYDKEHFLLVASDGLAEKSLGTTAIGFSEGLVGLVGQREEPLNIADAHQHPHFKYSPEVEEDDLKAFLGTPIIHQRKVIGIISIQQRESRSFTENEEAFLVTLSAQLATSFSNVEARSGLRHSSGTQWSKPIIGVPGSSGVAIGQIIVKQPSVDLRKISLKKVYSTKSQTKRLLKAIKTTQVDFERMGLQLGKLISDSSLDIFEMYKQMLESPQLTEEIEEKIQAGWNAESALKLVIDNYVIQFEAIEDPYLRERATDIRDLGNRVLQHLQSDATKYEKLPSEFVLLAEDVTATMLAEYQHQGLIAVVSISGSNNSHAAILARALGLPAVMGIETAALDVFDQKNAIVDGYSGEIFIEPNENLTREYLHLIDEEKALSAKVSKVADLPSVTLDGKSIELLLNAGLTSGFEHAVHSGAAGIGLYRTEIPFMNRSCFPSEQEQTVWYQDVLTAFPHQPVTMRTLDVGGDKSLPYFPIVEENPFLGWRGIRITLDHPEIFLLQVRAMIRANQATKNIEIMLPMIASIGEVEEALRLINQAYYELKSELSEDLVKPKIGIMIEVPSAIFLIKELAERVDFFSVGSNDLTQYLLAVDRNNARVASLFDVYHPAVLRALQYIAHEAQTYKVPLSLCGELASEPAGALLLLAMGYDKLSMNPHNLARVKWVIRHVDYAKAQKVLAHTLTLCSPKEVKSYLNEQLELFGLGGFVRAGM